jgi:hypothetical protein
VTLNVNLEDVPWAILEMVKARIMANRKKLEESQEQSLEAQLAASAERPQYRSIGASTRRRVDPEPGSVYVVSTPKSFGFSLVPAQGFDDAIRGPFGEFQGGDWSAAWGGHGGTDGRTFGYDNKLWGLQYSVNYALTGDFSSDSSFAQRPTFANGRFLTNTDTLTTPIDTGTGFETYEDQTFGAFALGHAVAADGQNLKIKKVEGESGTLYINADTEEPFQPIKPVSTASTIEFIVKLGASAGAANKGSSGFTLTLIGLDANGGTLGAVGELIELRDGQITYNGAEIEGEAGGSDYHVAVVNDSGTIRRYFHGELVSESTLDEGAFAVSEAQVLFIECRLEDSGVVPFRKLPGDSEFTVWDEFLKTYNGPSALKGIRYTDRALYSGPSFVPPTSLPLK